MPKMSVLRQTLSLGVTKFALERTNLHSQLEIKQNSLFHLIASSLMSELN